MLCIHITEEDVALHGMMSAFDFGSRNQEPDETKHKRRIQVWKTNCYIKASQNRYMQENKAIHA